MSTATVFLAVMIIALGIGNALFFFVRRRDRPASAIAAEAGGGQGAVFAAAGGPNPSETAQQSMFFSAAPMEKKIELAHARLQALESRVKSMQGIYEETLKGKIDRLEAFRDTANAEIIAVKEILDEMRAKSPPSSGEEKKNAAVARDSDISAEDVRRLIYRSHS